MNNKEEASFFYDAVEVGKRMRVGSFKVSAEEIIAFGLKWDPLPVHIDPVAAAKSPFGGLTAPGALALAIKQRLVHELPLRESIVASLGFDTLRFLKPLRPDDTVCVEIEWVSKRLSSKHVGCGVVVLDLRLLNQHDDAVLRHLDTVLMRLR